jgi:ABC-type Zn uptake system ZnuABC Zn-binding protein ZnuA
LLAAPLLLTACGDDSSANDDDKIQVVTTLPLFADFVRNVGGDRVEVTSLLPLGADPHTFEPSPRDVEKVANADIAFANGLSLEPSLIKVLEANLPDDVELVKLGDEVADHWEVSANDSSITDDPHLWLNPSLADRYLDVIWARLERFDSEAGREADQYFLGRKFEFSKAINQEWGRFLTEELPNIPNDRRTLVTAHEAFHHLANAYQLAAIAAVVESPGQEPSPSEIAELTEAIEAQNTPAVFTEPQISEESRILGQAAEEAGVQVCTLYSDSLDEEVSTYIEMMRFNADELARCLGGDSVD